MDEQFLLQEFEKMLDEKFERLHLNLLDPRFDRIQQQLDELLEGQKTLLKISE